MNQGFVIFTTIAQIGSTMTLLEVDCTPQGPIGYPSLGHRDLDHQGLNNHKFLLQVPYIWIYALMDQVLSVSDHLISVITGDYSLTHASFSVVNVAICLCEIASCFINTNTIRLSFDTVDSFVHHRRFVSYQNHRVHVKFYSLLPILVLQKDI